ncbi:GbsR/MarR family transcriptional regulator [Exilibacterium tricleocarpae]|uniref:HTH-type transcriptional regulator n=1 Tax=Exilibacterium tricleocarpae TaxID=2591008 RepID=A0A545SY77_9GAMM|nr:GbsR/MarR family transcriptional regulator [Exilibacterium tricleocarpae]TQV69913.1 GbsR/MarR family transcriptional regulator [Exilibacterium tricleocarpae]
MNLTPMIQSFVLHFGEMGSRWGINRTVGQIYALLVLTQRPLNADQMAAALGFSRSNVSMGLKELQSWRLIRLQHIPGDRKEYYSAPEDIWEIARTLIEERRKREIDPTLSLLRDVLLESPANEDEQYAQARMQEMHDLIELLTSWSADMQNVSSDKLYTLLKLGSGVSKVIDMKDKLMGGKKGANDP